MKNTSQLIASSNAQQDSGIVVGISACLLGMKSALMEDTAGRNIAVAHCRITSGLKSSARKWPPALVFPGQPCA
ncbi:hypothetical protein [Aliamphritea spongicola]|nr:hypothetical protein [Aliamphritea spongicola]